MDTLVFSSRLIFISEDCTFTSAIKRFSSNTVYCIFFSLSSRKRALGNAIELVATGLSKRSKRPVHRSEMKERKDENDTCRTCRVCAP